MRSAPERGSRPVFAALAPIVFAAPCHGTLPAMVHTSAARSQLVWSWSEIDGPADVETHSTNITSLGPLDNGTSAITSSGGEGGADSASSLATITHHSSPRPDGLDAAGAITAQATGAGTVGEAQAAGSTVLAWTIEITRDTTLTLDGALASTGVEHSKISLTGPGVSFQDSVNRRSGSIEVHERFDAPRGAWTLVIEMSAGSEYAAGGGEVSRSASYDMHLTVDAVTCTDCSEDCDGSGVLDAYELAGRVYFGARDSGRVFVIEPSEWPGSLTRAIDLGPDYEGIEAMVYNPVTRRVLIVAKERDIFSANRLLWLDPESEEVSVGILAIRSPDYAFDAMGRLWGLNSLLGFNKVEYVRISTTTGAIVAHGPSVPENFPSRHNLILSPKDGLLYHWTSSGTLRRFNPMTQTVESTLTSAVSGFDGVSFTADGARVFGMQSTNWYIVDPATGAVTTLYPLPMAASRTGGFVYVPVLRDDDLDGIPDACQCAGNVANDTIVDIADLNAVLSNWLVAVGVGSPLDLANGDGLVDADDLNILLANWGVSCGG